MSKEPYPPGVEATEGWPDEEDWDDLLVGEDPDAGPVPYPPSDEE